MKTLSLLLSAVLLMACMACQQQPATLTEAQKAEIVEQVTARQTELFNTFRALDADATGKLLSPDNFLAYSTIEQHWNRQTFLDTLKINWFGSRKSSQYDLVMLKIYPLAGDLAIADSKISGSVTTKEDVKGQGKNVFTLTWKKESDQWYIIHYSESWKYNIVTE